MSLRNNRGQMAIFIALFFQVIFIFFAMAINVGLVVHDKINLQTAVDMAAYYGAMKQGEVLNQIAHINYQMRQNYKLFTWRYRVLGTMGNQSHPLSYVKYNAGNTSLYPEGNSVDQGIQPTVCISHSVFQETVDLDPDAATVCKQDALALPAIPAISPPAGLVPGSGALPGTFEFIQDQLNKFCLEAGVFNWLYSARILAHYRIDGLERKKMIWKLAGNLSGPDPKDLRDESIKTGVENTFKKNLTNTNLGSIESGTGQFFFENSLGKGPCDKVEYWLPEIRIYPLIFFSDWNVEADNSCGAAAPVPNRLGVTSTPRSTPPAPGGEDNLPSAFSKSAAQWQNWYNNPLSVKLRGYWSGEPGGPANQPTLHSSVGFEKNPWCMVYSGVQAQTTVKKPFDPTGGGVTLQARAFAKPFGGRIGPWYGKTWPRGSSHSVAGSRAERVDPLLPTRAVTGGPAPSGNALEEVANYSRFPGDEFGMGSMRAMSAMIGKIMPAFNHFANTDTPAIAVANYNHLGGTGSFQDTKDSLAREGQLASGTKAPKQRPFEIGAVVPDVFDALNYSIEPQYFDNYFTENTTGGGANFSDQEKQYDYGSSEHNYEGTSPKNFSVKNQIELIPNVYEGDYNVIIRKWENLLTSWHQKAIVDYTLDDARFGKCSKDVPNAGFPTTGNCIVGGRTGYSVKLISHDYLTSGDHQVGGGSTGGGSIEIPPSF